MSKYGLSNEDSIDDINPFVLRDFSLPGGVKQTGDFADFSSMRVEPGLSEDNQSVFCDYALCRRGNDCSLSKELQPRRNIDPGFVDKPSTNKLIRIGVANKPNFSMIGWIIFLVFFFTILYYVRR